jgi:hypothetical protein
MPELLRDPPQVATAPASAVPVFAAGRTPGAAPRAATALAVLAVAAGAFAIGALAIGRLAIGRARVRRLEIDDLVVRRLRVTEALDVPSGARADQP